MRKTKLFYLVIIMVIFCTLSLPNEASAGFDFFKNLFSKKVIDPLTFTIQLSDAYEKNNEYVKKIPFKKVIEDDDIRLYLGPLDAYKVSDEVLEQRWNKLSLVERRTIIQNSGLANPFKVGLQDVSNVVKKSGIKIVLGSYTGFK